MFRTLITRLKAWETRLRSSFGNDISTPAGRRAAHLHFQLMDHAFFRIWWTNLAEIAPGVWRSNQPSPKRVARYKAMGIKSILFLRGFRTNSFQVLEEDACNTHNIAFLKTELAARKAPKREMLLQLLDIFETIERPFLMHCKSGADRAGLASALYLMHIEGRSVEEASEQLHVRYLHVKNSRTGVLDHFLDTYAEDTRETPMPIREWIATKYDRQALQASFADLHGKPEWAKLSSGKNRAYRDPNG